MRRTSETGGIIGWSIKAKQNKGCKVDDLETKHPVLVHGGGFNAWCWYKTIAFLLDGGFKVDAIELTGSGIRAFDPNNVTSLSQYSIPLASFLERLGDGEKTGLPLVSNIGR